MPVHTISNVAGVFFQKNVQVVQIVKQKEEEEVRPFIKNIFYNDKLYSIEVKNTYRH